MTAIPTKGTWLGITDQIESFMEVKRIEIADNDVALFFTDGVTEGTEQRGEMYGQERLQEVFAAAPTSRWRKPWNGSSTMYALSRRTRRTT